MSNTRHIEPNVAKAEATGEGIPVEFDDELYEIPPSSEWPLDAVEAAENGQIVTATKLILGPKQWAEFRKAHTTLGDLERFMETLSELTGGNL